MTYFFPASVTQTDGSTDLLCVIIVMIYLSRHVANRHRAEGMETITTLRQSEPNQTLDWARQENGKLKFSASSHRCTSFTIISQPGAQDLLTESKTENRLTPSEWEGYTFKRATRGKVKLLLKIPSRMLTPLGEHGGTKAEFFFFWENYTILYQYSNILSIHLLTHLDFVWSIFTNWLCAADYC